MELKAIRQWQVLPKTPVFGNAGLSKEQIAWHVAASQRGVVAFIWGGVGTGAKRRTFLVPSTEAEQFNSMTKVAIEQWEVKLASLPSVLKILGVALPLAQQKQMQLESGK